MVNKIRKMGAYWKKRRRRNHCFAPAMMALRARYHFNPRVPLGTDKTRNKTEEKQEITFLNIFSLFLLHSLFILLLSPKNLKWYSWKKLYNKVRLNFSLPTLPCTQQWLNSSCRNSPERLAILLRWPELYDCAKVNIITYWSRRKMNEWILKNYQHSIKIFNNYLPKMKWIILLLNNSRDDIELKTTPC